MVTLAGTHVTDPHLVSARLLGIPYLFFPKCGNGYGNVVPCRAVLHQDREEGGSKHAR